MNTNFVNIDLAFLTILFSGVILLIFTIIKIIEIKKAENNKKVILLPIWLTGVIAFFLGILGQTIMLEGALKDIERLGYMNTGLIAHAVSGTIYLGRSGLLILILSVIIWGFLKYILLKKQNRI